MYNIDFRRKLRNDILEAMYSNGSNFFIPFKQIYTLLDKLGVEKYGKVYMNVTPDKLHYSFELKQALNYLTEKGYLKLKYEGVYEENRLYKILKYIRVYEERLYKISVEGIDYFENLNSSEKDKDI